MPWAPPVGHEKRQRALQQLSGVWLPDGSSLFSVLRLFALVTVGPLANAFDYDKYATCMCNVLVACACFIDYWYDWHGMVSMLGLYVFRNDIIRLFYIAVRYVLYRFVKRHVYADKCRV